MVRHLVGMEALASGTVIAVGGKLHGSTVDEDGSYAAALAIGGGERIAEVIGGNGYGRGVEVEADIRGLMLVLLRIRVVTLEQVVTSKVPSWLKVKEAAKTSPEAISG